MRFIKEAIAGTSIHGSNQGYIPVDRHIHGRLEAKYANGAQHKEGSKRKIFLSACSFKQDADGKEDTRQQDSCKESINCANGAAGDTNDSHQFQVPHAESIFFVDQFTDKVDQEDHTGTDGGAEDGRKSLLPDTAGENAAKSGDQRKDAAGDDQFIGNDAEFEIGKCDHNQHSGQQAQANAGDGQAEATDDQRKYRRKDQDSADGLPLPYSGNLVDLAGRFVIIAEAPGGHFVEDQGQQAAAGRAKGPEKDRNHGIHGIRHWACRDTARWWF